MVTQTKQVQSVVAYAIFVALLLSLVAPSLAAAAKPELTGQEKAATVGNKADTEDASSEEDATSEDEASANDDDAEGSEDEDSSEVPTKKNVKANNGADKTTGLARAMTVAKREEIRAKLSVMMELIAELQSRLNEMRGIGSAVSNLNPNEYDEWGNNDEEPTEPTDASPYVLASLIATDETLVLNDDLTQSDDEGEFTFELEVTASGTDITIPDVASTENATTTGVIFSVLNASGTVMSTGTLDGVLTTSGSTTTDGFLIVEGETETITVTVTYDPAEAGMYQAVIASMNTSEGAITFTPAEDYQTDLIVINN